MKYYISRYLNSVEVNNCNWILFNGVNGAMDEIDNTIGKAFYQADTNKVLNLLGEQEKKYLLNRGYLTTLTPEEELFRFKEFVFMLHKKSQEGAEYGGIMLLMSYNCNLSCDYCYQKEHRPIKSGFVMSEELVEEIFDKLLDKLIPGIKPEKTRISFYGGEPFLNHNKQVILKALGYAKKYNMCASSITNGTNVDKMMDIFGSQAGKVSWCQISLDGARAIHDKSRIPSNGNPTFDRITDNVQKLLDRGVKVSLRLNLDRKKLESITYLIEELKTKGIIGHKNVHIYASPLHDNIARVDATDFLDLVHLSQELFNIGIDLEHPVSLRANEMNLLFKLKKGMGLRQSSFCMQTTQRTLVVDPFGDLYACFEEAGYPQYRIGQIKNGDVEFFPLRRRYMERHIGNMAECLKCSVALACGGQCGIKCRIKTGDIFKPYCEDMKKLILEGLKVSYKKFKDQENQGQPRRLSQAEPEIISTHNG